jgi:hypothetical protein
MAEPIYKVFMARFSEAWYQLSEEEQNSFKAKMGEALEKAGGKSLMMCGTNWSSDQWSFAGMEEFPSIEAVQNYMAAADELNLFRYVEATSVLGTKFESK